MDSVPSLITCLAFHKALLPLPLIGTFLNHSHWYRVHVQSGLSPGTFRMTHSWCRRLIQLLLLLTDWLWALDSVPRSTYVGHAKIECIDPSRPGWLLGNAASHCLCIVTKQWVTAFLKCPDKIGIPGATFFLVCTSQLVWTSPPQSRASPWLRRVGRDDQSQEFAEPSRFWGETDSTTQQTG